ncbi:universal stress protein [Fulvivirga imtechensis]|nr:universal stress protein [Fulvivirga imtechensis]
MFKRIIFPTDFSESSAKAFSYVLDVVRSHQSELIILYTYRLISGADGRYYGNKISIKREREEEANKQFEQLKQCYPELSDFEHHFLTEVGFVSDRISLAVERFNIDLVVLSESIQQQLKEKWEMSDENLPGRFHCPVLLVPSEVVNEQETVKVG